MIRLVALDIDGTLLDSSNRLSDNTAAVRKRC
jgi:hydroxymethylpyrimidine pyrophosphatase-like HAD family hydrolase